MEELNWLAVAVATLAFYALGALWYSPLLFVNQWMKAVGITKETAKQGNMAKIMGLGLVAMFIVVLMLAMFLRLPNVDAMMGARYGFYAGFGFMSMAVAINALYEMRPVAYFLINGGYFTLGLTLAGLILGAWR